MAKAKTIDKAKIISKIIRQLKKEFGALPKRQPTSVLETVLFGICLENATYDQAQLAFDRLSNDFFDWNEIRVSTITELLPVFDGLTEPEKKAHRIRALLYYVFDHEYSYNFDSIKKKPLELVQKQLSKIKHMTPFLRNYLLQLAMGTHVIPCDDRMVDFIVYLGLLPYGANPDDAAVALKTFVKKADGHELFWLLKNVSACTKANFFEGFNFESEEEMTFENASARLDDVFNGKAKRRAGRLRAEAVKAAAKAAEEAKATERAEKRRATARIRAVAKAEAEAQAEAERIAAEKEKEAKAKARAAQRKKTVKAPKKTVKAPKKTVKAPKKAAKKTVKAPKKAAKKTAAKKTASKKPTAKKKTAKAKTAKKTTKRKTTKKATKKR